MKFLVMVAAVTVSSMLLVPTLAHAGPIGNSALEQTTWPALQTADAL